MNTIIKISFFVCISFLFVLTSCNKDQENLENITDESMFLMDLEARHGKRGCHKIVFPVTINFPDESSQEIENHIQLRRVIKEWKSNNQPGNGRPHIVFPYEILNGEGESITVENREQQQELKKECRGSHGHPYKSCFRIEFPISIEFPNGETVEVEGRRALKKLKRTWRKNNPESMERPHFVFPIDVTLKDGTTKTIDSKEELIALRKRCRG